MRDTNKLVNATGSETRYVAIAEMGDNIEFNVPMPIRSRCLVYAFCRHLLKSEKGHSEQKHNR